MMHDGMPNGPYWRVSELISMYEFAKYYKLLLREVAHINRSFIGPLF